MHLLISPDAVRTQAIFLPCGRCARVQRDTRKPLSGSTECRTHRLLPEQSRQHRPVDGLVNHGTREDTAILQEELFRGPPGHLQLVAQAGTVAVTVQHPWWAEPRKRVKVDKTTSGNVALIYSGSDNTEEPASVYVRPHFSASLREASPTLFRQHFPFRKTLSGA